MFGMSLLFLCLIQSVDPFTVVILPDTQKFVRYYPYVYEEMTTWIYKNKDKENIVFVGHVGDIVDNEHQPLQWERARFSMDILAQGNIPFGTAPGNHDLSFSDVVEGKSLPYVENFGPKALYQTSDPSKGIMEEQSWYGGSSASGQSSYQIIKNSGLNILFLHLQVDTRIAELDWAKKVVKNHPNHYIILLTHRWIADYRIIRTRFGPLLYGTMESFYFPDSMGAQRTFDELVFPNKNIGMVLCGHIVGEVRKNSKNEFGLDVHELLSDYSHFSPQGGGGWMRLMEFDPSANEVRVKTFSPTIECDSPVYDEKCGRERTHQDQLNESKVVSERVTKRLCQSIQSVIKKLDKKTTDQLIKMLSKKGAPSAFFYMLKSKDDFVIKLMSTLFQGNEKRAKEFLEVIPFDDINWPMIEQFSENAELLVPMLFENRHKDLAIWYQEDEDRIERALFQVGNSEPKFTLKVEFEKYIK